MEKTNKRHIIIGGSIGTIIGLLGFTPLLKIISIVLFPLFLPLMIFTESVLGIELEGVCQSAWCVIPYGVFTTIYFGLIGLLIGYILSRLRKRQQNEKHN